MAVRYLKDPGRCTPRGKRLVRETVFPTYLFSRPRTDHSPCVLTGAVVVVRIMPGVARRLCADRLCSSLNAAHAVLVVVTHLLTGQALDFEDRVRDQYADSFHTRRSGAESSSRSVLLEVCRDALVRRQFGLTRESQLALYSTVRSAFSAPSVRRSAGIAC